MTSSSDALSIGKVAGIALTAALVILAALLSAPAATAASAVPSTCVNAYNPRNSHMVAHVCVNPRFRYIHVSDTESDGLAATGFWSSETVNGLKHPIHDRCVDATKAGGPGVKCPFDNPATGPEGPGLVNGDTVCFRASATNHGEVVYLSDRVCVLLIPT